MWPGITPLNVWDLDLATWIVFALNADDWVAQTKQNANTRRR